MDHRYDLRGSYHDTPDFWGIKLTGECKFIATILNFLVESWDIKNSSVYIFFNMAGHGSIKISCIGHRIYLECLPTSTIWLNNIKIEWDPNIVGQEGKLLTFPKAISISERSLKLTCLQKPTQHSLSRHICVSLVRPDYVPWLMLTALLYV